MTAPEVRVPCECEDGSTVDVVAYRGDWHIRAASRSLAVVGPGLGSCSWISRLFLQMNALRTLPDDIASLRLISLTLDDNRFDQLPPCVFRITRLRELSFNRNRVRKCPPGITALDCLTSLAMYGNGIGRLPSSLGRLTRLELLSVSDFETDPPFRWLPPTLSALTRLDSLYLMTEVDGERMELSATYAEDEAQQGLRQLMIAMRCQEFGRLCAVATGLAALDLPVPLVLTIFAFVHASSQPDPGCHLSEIDRWNICCRIKAKTTTRRQMD